MKEDAVGRSRSLRPDALGLLLAVSLAGCFALGPRTVPRDRFDYGSAIARSRNEQMLLNIVRLRYMQVPAFLTVSSVIAGYTYEGSVAIVGQGALPSFDEDFVGGAANLDYVERPTITYTPLSGEEFSRRMLQTIPIDMLFSLGQSGWPPDVLLRIAVQRIGETQNIAFAPGDLAGTQAFQAEADKLERYDRVVQLLLRLEHAGAFEVVRLEDEPPHFRFARQLTPELRALADELKVHLGLPPDRDSFRVTDRLTARGPDEILIRTRSLLAILSFLAQGVEVPEEDARANRALVLPPHLQEVMRARGPLHVRTQRERPEDAHTAIRYRDRWFYVDGGDHLSKRTFATILVLFELLAPAGGGAAPLLSLPTG
jgi:hypothetical protein